VKNAPSSPNNSGQWRTKEMSVFRFPRPDYTYSRTSSSLKTSVLSGSRHLKPPKCGHKTSLVYTLDPELNVYTSLHTGCWVNWLTRAGFSIWCTQPGWCRVWNAQKCAPYLRHGFPCILRYLNMKLFDVNS
jgi:hypothetical protein